MRCDCKSFVISQPVAVTDGYESGFFSGDGINYGGATYALRGKYLSLIFKNGFSIR
jgi:hypothetical protein